MNTLNEIFGWTLVATSLLDMWAVYARDLMMLQQNSYRRERYYRWFSQSGDVATRVQPNISFSVFIVSFLRLMS